MDGTEEQTVLEAIAAIVSLENEAIPRCCIATCPNSKYRPDRPMRDILCFPVPQEPNRHHSWLKVLNEHMTDTGTQDYSQLHVCSDHFEVKDIIYNNDQPELLHHALPRIHLNTQSGIQVGGNLKEELMVKMEIMSEAEEGKHRIVSSDPHCLSSKQGSYSKVTRINMSPNTVEKFIKGENLLNGLENCLGDIDTAANAMNTRDKNETSLSQASTSISSTNVGINFKRKRGRPKKGTYTPKKLASQNSSSSNQDSSTNFVFANTSRTIKESLLSYDSTEDPVDGETDIDTKPKRKRRSRVLDDFVADFNTSDEEEDAFLSNFPKFPSRGRGRGRGKRPEISDPFDEDLFSSYIGVFGKKFSIEEDFPTESMLADIGNSDEDLFSPPNSSPVKGPSESKEITIGSDGLEGVIGPNGNTKVQIINTGQTEVVDNEEFLLYNVITNTGSTRTITPLRISKLANNGHETDTGTKSQPSTSQVISKDSEEDVESSKPDETSPLRKKKHKQMISQQVASLRQRYYRALQELRKRPRAYTLADLVCGASNFLTEDQLIFFTLQLKSGCNNMQGIRFSVREKMLALGFYLQSPGLYKWLRSVFHLPSKLILDRWLEGLAKNDPQATKRLMYRIYTRYVFKS